MSLKRIGILVTLLLCVFLLPSCASGNKDTNKGNQSGDKGKTQQGVPFSGYDLETDKLVDNAMLKGKKVNIVSIWQITCPPCETESKALEIIHKNNPDVGIIGLCAAENSADIAKTANKWGLTYKNYKMDNNFLKAMNGKVKSTPTLFYVDENGVELIPMQVGTSSQGNKPEEIAKEISKKLETIKTK